jgi:hypothetical protein
MKAGLLDGRTAVQSPGKGPNATSDDEKFVNFAGTQCILAIWHPEPILKFGNKYTVVILDALPTTIVVVFAKNGRNRGLEILLRNYV